MNLSKLIHEVVEKGYEIRIRGDVLHDHPLVRVELYQLDKIERAAAAVVVDNAFIILGVTIDCPEALKSRAMAPPVKIRQHTPDDTDDNYDSDGTVPEQTAPNEQ